MFLYAFLGNIKIITLYLKKIKNKKKFKQVLCTTTLTSNIRISPQRRIFSCRFSCRKYGFWCWILSRGDGAGCGERMHHVRAKVAAVGIGMPAERRRQRRRSLPGLARPGRPLWLAARPPARAAGQVRLSSAPTWWLCISGNRRRCAALRCVARHPPRRRTLLSLC